MKNSIFWVVIFLVFDVQAAVQTLYVQAKIYSFDLNTVTIEVVGEKYKLDRKKLGPAFRNLKAGDSFDIEINQKFLNK